MRVRRQKAPPPGFTLALPPPDTSDELHVQAEPKNELFINVDDNSVSPMVTTEGPLFPARFFHVNNTNLFVLMDGVSMFTEGKAAHKEEVPSHRLGEKVEGTSAAKSVKKAHQTNPTTVVDSVEAAIRGIENAGNDCFSSLASSTAVSPTAKRSFESMSSLGPQAPSSSPVASSSSNAAAVAATAPVGGGGGGGGVYSRTETTLSTVERHKTDVPKEYAVLFSNNNDSLTKTLNARAGSASTAVRIRGFLPSSVTAGHIVVPASAPRKVAETYAAPVPDEPPTSSVVSTVTEPNQHNTSEKNGGHKYASCGAKQVGRVFSAQDVGRTNRSLDLDAVVTLCFIGNGSQGTVHRVMLDEKLYALKCIDLKEVTQATNAVERQGRKRGLVKELNMIRLQRLQERPEHLMQMFNAAATIDNGRQHLYILMELMSFSVEDAQRMFSRIPANEMMKVTQSIFRKHLAGSAQVQKQTENLLKQQSASCMHLTGRSSYNTPEEWETNIDRQAPVPEIILSMLAADVLKGLKELHEDYSIVHCDLKPANVLLDFNKTRFKLADFGCGCQTDPKTHRVRQTGVDLGSKVYKAPERLRSELYGKEMEDGLPVVEFTPAADVWSLGVMLLELSNGVNPCYSFKSDYWNYVNNLKLSRMVKPLSWSASFHDFIVRCLMREPSHRWSVNKLLQHPFILRYNGVPREKLKTFMERLKSESETFQRRRQRELLEEQVLLSTGMKARDSYQNRSRTCWKAFTGFLSVAPQFQDTEKFPSLN
ncbi:putative protein kinase [Trypanosoma grayi]|uniref:putative protein kinase n=1 Tax=Trypanosoma grayi TaxID=71804 RepID=UPI0004F4793C|nr:putative protein kinase [Trypanosoma grayi]KEG12988.1 putative protein kinase [Trypanosoma grayi]